MEYSRKQLERAWLRVVAGLIGANDGSLPADDVDTDLRHDDGEPLTVGELIEALWVEYGLVDDNGEAVAQTEVPAEMYVSTRERIDAWKARKAAEEAESEIPAFVLDVERRDALYKAHKAQIRAQEKAAQSASAIPAPIPVAAPAGVAVQHIDVGSIAAAITANPSAFAEALKALGYSHAKDEPPASSETSPNVGISPAPAAPALKLVESDVEGDKVVSVGGES